MPEEAITKRKKKFTKKEFDKRLLIIAKGQTTDIIDDWIIELDPDVRKDYVEALDKWVTMLKGMWCEES